MAGPFEILEYGAIQVQVQVGQITEANLRAHLDRQTRVINDGVATGPPYRKAVIVVDASVELVPPAKVRRMQAEWTNAHADKLQKILHAMAFVVPSAMTRGAMTAVLWLTRPAWPMVTQPSLESAMTWALEQADTIGADVDSRLRRLGATAVVRDRAALLTG